MHPALISLFLTLGPADSTESRGLGPTVLWLEGEVTPGVPGDPLPRVAARLAAGQEWVLAPGATLEVLAEPNAWALAVGPGRVVVTADGLEARSTPPPLLAAEPLHGVGLDARRGPVAVRLGEAPGPRLALRSPAATRLTEPVRRLAWEDPHQGVRYELELAERLPDGSWKTLEQWKGLSGTSHELWAPLAAGRVYRWTVVSQPSLPGALPLRHDATWCEVLSEAQAAQVVEDLATLRGWEARLAPGTPSFVVLQALLLEAWGLYERAEAVWAGLVEHHPDVPALGEHLRAVVGRSAAPL